MTGTLYIVATPIGNLEDITYRAVRVLSEVGLVAAEDTRRTGLLLRRYQIDTPMRRFHEHIEARVTPVLLDQIEAGLSVALVSDAGTPGISDPGFVLVRGALERGIPVVPIPGPSATTAALLASGLPIDRFEFIGFLPKKRGKRDRLLALLLARGHTVVAFESPQRVLETVNVLLDLDADARVAIGRELTKVHEEWVRGTARDVHALLARRSTIKGEIVILFCGTAKPETITKAEG